MRPNVKKYICVFLAAALLCAGALALSGCSKQVLEYTVAPGGQGRMISKCDPHAEEVKIPEKYRGLPVVGVAHGAFSGCSRLTSIVLPETVTVIESDAFYGCSGLTEFVIPAGVTELGDGAFTNCKKLTSIVIPEGITVLEEALFMGNVGLESVTIPSTVTRIEDKVFYNCSSLTSLTLPEGLTEIGNSSFVDCSALAEISLPDSLVSMGASPLRGTAYEADEKNWNGVSLCNGKWLLDVSADASGEYVIPAGIERVAQFAGSGISGITSLVVPEGVRSLGASAFADCHSLVRVTLPASLEALPDYAFHRCDALSEIDLGKISSIGHCAFVGCVMLRNVTIPASVREICDSAFVSGVGLTAVTFEAPAGWFVSVPEGGSSGAVSENLLSDPSLAASLLAYDYNHYLWTRK